MYKKCKKILVCICMIISIFDVIAFAGRSDVDSIVFVGKNQAELLKIANQANGLYGVDVLEYTGNDGLLSFSNTKYASLSVDEKRKFMESVLLSIKESGLGTQIKNKAYNFISDQDTTVSSAVKFLKSDASADFAVASAWFKPFGSVMGVILGFLSLMIFMFIGLSSLIDIAYMVIPMFKVALDGSKGKPRFISTEAYSSVLESEQSAGKQYKSSVSLYLKRRFPALMLMSIALGYLISGKIYDIVIFFIDSFTWVL